MCQQTLENYVFFPLWRGKNIIKIILLTKTAHSYKSSHTKILDFALDKNAKRKTLHYLIEELHSLGWIISMEIDSYKLCDWFLIREWYKWIVKFGKAKAKRMTHCASCNNNVFIAFFPILMSFPWRNDQINEWFIHPLKHLPH